MARNICMNVSEKTMKNIVIAFTRENAKAQSSKMPRQPHVCVCVCVCVCVFICEYIYQKWRHNLGASTATAQCVAIFDIYTRI